MSQKRFITCLSLLLPLMLRFQKMTLENLKIGKLSVTLATSNFQDLFVPK